MEKAHFGATKESPLFNVVGTSSRGLCLTVSKPSQAANKTFSLQFCNFSEKESLHPPMNTPRLASYHRSLLPISFAAALLSGLSASAAQFTWDEVTGLWSLGTNWTPDIVPSSAVDTELLFGGSGSTPYTSTNDIAGVFQLNKLTLNSAATVSETINASVGSSLSFVSNGPTTPALLQNGSGAFTISTDLGVANALALGGTGTGLTTLSGILSGAGGLTFTGSNWQLSNIANSFTGGVTVNTGAFVELVPSGAAPQNVNFATGATSLLGGNTSNTLTINGGTLKLTSKGTGNVALGAARPVTFGSNGGILDITNTSGTPGTQGGNIASGDLALTLNNSAGSPAVIRWNGGQLGLSNNNATNGDWTTGSNALRISSLTGTGPLRIELSNGALLRGSIVTGAVDSIITNPLTIRGVIGGEPTSGPDGTLPTGVSLTTGRMQFDSSRVNYNGGLTLEGAMAINPANRATAINGNITIASNGYVAFQGRGTGTNLSNVIQNPGSTTNPGHNVLWIGENSSTTLTVQNGGIAVFDGRNRIDQNNAHGVLLGGNAVLNAGGTLRIAQSISNYSNIPNPAVASNYSTTQNEGDIILRGNITAQGTTANESLLDIKLPAPDAAGTIANGTPTPLAAAAPAAGTRPFAGLVTEGTHNIVIDGSGFGGLRVTASSRPDRLFSATGLPGGAATPDPTSNVTKLNSYLTATRLAAITGSAGYLTPGANGGAWTFPAGGEWLSGVTVGLRIADLNTSGTDVIMAPSTWSHNLAVDAGATLDTGATAFTFLAGTLQGKGNIIGAGGLVVGGTAAIAPGLGDVGTLSGDHLTLQGTPTLLFNLSSVGNGSDRLSLTGAFDGTSGPFQFDFAGGGLAGQTYTLANFSSTTFGVSNFIAANLAPGLTGTFQVTSTELRFSVVPEPSAALSLLGGMAVLVGWRRKSR